MELNSYSTSAFKLNLHSLKTYEKIELKLKLKLKLVTDIRNCKERQTEKLSIVVVLLLFWFLIIIPDYEESGKRENAIIVLLFII